MTSRAPLWLRTNQRTWRRAYREAKRLLIEHKRENVTSRMQRAWLAGFEAGRRAEYFKTRRTRTP